MQKSKIYKNTKFSVEAINNALKIYQGLGFSDAKIKSLEVTVGDESWRHDNLPEFYNDYRKYGSQSSLYIRFDDKNSLSFSHYESRRTNVSVEAENRITIHSVFSVFEEFYPKCILPEDQKIDTALKIFIGHGRNTAWRDLKDHLQDKHGYKIIAYETGARAGHVIRDIVGEMSQEATMAFLVLTAEDEQVDGSFHSRQNVVHETGLFQGVLGFSRAIVLLEEGTEAFSNLQGIDQIRFSKGNIKETFGEVLATIKREFS